MTDWWAAVVHDPWGNVGRLAVMSFLLLATMGIFVWLLQVHWVLGGGLLLFYGYALFLGLQDLKGRTLGITQALGAMVMLVCLSAALFATLSFMLEAAGLAEYRSEPTESMPAARFVQLLAYYGWLFLDLLPVVKVMETLRVPSPVEPEGVVAGLPVVAFRGFVVLVLLLVIHDWWRTRDAPGSSAGSGEPQPENHEASS